MTTASSRRYSASSDLGWPKKIQKWPKKIGATTWSLHMLHIQTLERSTLSFKLGNLHSLTEGQILRSFQIFSSVWKGGSWICWAVCPADALSAKVFVLYISRPPAPNLEPFTCNKQFLMRDSKNVLGLKMLKRTQKFGTIRARGTILRSWSKKKTHKTGATLTLTKCK